MSKRKSKEEWQIESDLKHNSEFEIIDEPQSGQHNVRILHKKCNNIISMKLNNHLKRYCKFCSNKNKKTKEDWQILSDQIHNSEFKILEEPKNGKFNVKILHIKCGNILSMTMNNHINHKNGCKRCSKYSLKSHQYWIDKCKDIWGDDYLILEEVTNNRQKVIILHTICQREHKKNMSSLIHGQRGCPYCSNTDLKYAERFIEKYLVSQNLKYIKEKTFHDLINPETGRKLRFDFYLPEQNLIVEVHGVQHYKPIDCWGGQVAFEKQIYRDGLKKNFLEKNNIKLLIINNKKLTEIKSIL
jgi:very-short-patch-repair endonuclease